MTPAWHPHPDVWVLVATLLGGYLYAVTRIGPRLVPRGLPAATPAQVAAWCAGVLVLWVAADWPVHDLSESSSFAFHALEHLLLALVAPPLLLLGTPSWLAREVLRPRALRAAAAAVTRPLPAFALFNLGMAVMFWPPAVSGMLASEPFHLASHLLMVLLGLVMWTPVLSPLPELPRLSPPLQMVYLFAQSILPTIPASFLTFASGPLYDAYLGLVPPFGMSIVEDQQVAGLLTKIGGGVVLWSAITLIFFRWYAEERRWDRLEEQLRRSG